MLKDLNMTTGDEWQRGHPFFHRSELALFLQYAQFTNCGFKVGDITFGSSFAWFSTLIAICGLAIKLHWSDAQLIKGRRKFLITNLPTFQEVSQLPGAYEQEHATPLYFCHGVFTDRFIFKSNLLSMRLPRECHNQSQDTYWRPCVTGPELPFFHKRKGILKIDQSVKMPDIGLEWELQGPARRLLSATY